MRIGISSWACPWAIGVAGHLRPERPMEAIDLVRLAAELGAPVVQIADNLPLDALSPEELIALAGEARRLGVEIEPGTRGIAPENLRKHLDIARALGARLVRTLPHDGLDRPDFQEALSRLRAVKPDFEAAGVVLAIENHDNYPSAWLRRVVDEAGSDSIGVCLDAVNNLGQGESFREVLAALGPRTLNFHCKDYRILRKPTMLGFDVVGASAGDGMLDIRLAMATLRPGISWILESWLPWQGDLPSTLAAEMDWLIRGVNHLRGMGKVAAR